MRNVLCIVAIVAGVLLAGNKAEAAHQIQHTDGTVATVVQMGDPICDTHKCLPVNGFTNETAAASADVPEGSAKPIWRDVVLLQDAQGNYVNFASEWGRCHFQGPRGPDNPYYVDMAYLGIDTPEELQAWCGRKAVRDNRVFAGTDYGIRRSFNGQYIPNHVIVVPGEPNGCLAIARDTDRAICEKVRIERDEARRALAQGGTDSTMRAELDCWRIDKEWKGDKCVDRTAGTTTAIASSVSQPKRPPAGSVEAAADRETMAVAVVQTKLAWVTLGLITLLIAVMALSWLWLQARRELRRCRGWLEEIRITANVGAETHYRDFATVIGRLMSDGTTTLRRLRSEKDAVFAKLRRDILDALAIGELRPDQNLADAVRAMREKGGVAVSAMSEIAEALDVGLDSKGDSEVYQAQATVVVVAVRGLQQSSARVTARNQEMVRQLTTANDALAAVRDELVNHGAGKCVPIAVHDAALAGHGADECVPVARHNAMLARAAEDLAIEVGKVRNLEEQLAGASEELARAQEQLGQRVLRSDFEVLQGQVDTIRAEVNRLNRLEAAMREMHGKVAGLRQLHTELTRHTRVKTNSGPIRAGIRALGATLEVLEANPMPAPAGN